MLALLCAGCDRGPAVLRVATPLLPVDREIAGDLAGLLATSPAVRLELTASSMTETDALEALAAGRADLALVSNSVPYRPGVAAVMPLYPTVLHVAYSGDREAPTGEDLLRGARVFAGPEGSASRLLFEAVVDHIGLGEDEFEYAETDPGVIVIFTPISPELVSRRPGIRLFSFGEPGDVGSGSPIDAVVLLNPHLRPFVIPARTYGETTPVPVLTLAVDQYLVAREGLDESVVYDLVGEMLRSRPALAARHPGLFENLSDEFDVTRSTFVVHAGTQAYLGRDEPTVYERYSGVAEVAVTLFVALFSAVVAGVRILKRRRKNRIDRFYARAIEIRDSITPESGDDERRAAIDRIRVLQDDAFGLLVDEKLAADESFRIFVTLSDDVLRRLGAGDAGCGGRG